ncbi:carboxymuconolactone decarboxylase family protein [Streptomyces sp. NPDC058045]|uniref:carboxymuconolactone decarboxylase family protein n=1 Tax=Streptomyces sp. NPDC058045 TaxID=3346311 RepID=UPI0036EE7B39
MPSTTPDFTGRKADAIGGTSGMGLASPPTSTAASWPAATDHPPPPPTRTRTAQEQRMTYHEHSDHQYAKDLRAGAPDAFKAFIGFDQAALSGSGKVIPRKYTELIAVAVALTTQCAYCVEAHTKAAHAEGATKEELAETTMIAAALRAGGAFAHGFMAMKFYDQAGQASQLDPSDQAQQGE